MRLGAGGPPAVLCAMSFHRPVATDWWSIFRAIDRDVTGWTPESLRAAYVEHGCAVVRGAIPQDTIAKLRAVTSGIYQRIDALHVYESQIAEATQGKLSGFDLVKNPLLQRFLDLVFAGQKYERESATARRIKASGSDNNWQEPLALHLDSYFHQFWFTVNFWVPFDECGVDAPCLQLLPLNYRDTRRYSGFSRKPVFKQKDRVAENSRFFPNDSLTPESVENDFGTGCLLRPLVRPGDVIIASNWLIHGSYRTPAMTKGRSSMEVRFIGRCPDIAVKPDVSDRYRIAAWFFANRVATKFLPLKQVGIPFWAQHM
jgi:ectoine hydroxylase-related dioxygenase (phytanoyl-CoA dioxygenase family)